jgi:hypothetical protein
LTTTANLGLTEYSVTAGSVTSFLDFRTAIAGTTSNFGVIDTWAGETTGSIVSLKSRSITTVSANQSTTNYYVATVATITSYITNMIINLKLDISIAGSTTINISSLGIITLKKVDALGSVVNLNSGDMIANQYYLFIYNGTYFVMISDTDKNRGITTSTSATYNIDWNTGNVFDITMTGNTTLTFSNLSAGKSINALFIQDGTGSRIITWPTIQWTDGSAVVLSTGSAMVDAFNFFVRSNGSSVCGFLLGKNVR